jgi:hypothetical protein
MSIDNKPFGITVEYRKSDEYNFLVKCVQGDYPSMPLYLIEMAITIHKNDPHYYKTAKKAERLHLAQSVNKSLVQQSVENQQKLDDYILYTVTVSDQVEEPSSALLKASLAANNISVIINNEHQTKENLQNSDTQPEQAGPKQNSV